jgi:hypothetical protein
MTRVVFLPALFATTVALLGASAPALLHQLGASNRVEDVLAHPARERIDPSAGENGVLSVRNQLKEAATALLSTKPSRGTPAPVDPCAGLAGLATSNYPGSRDTPIEVAYALEYDYYVKRDPAAVISLYAPGVINDNTKRDIAVFINKIPQGTKYCVSATLVDQTTVNYDVNEVRPDADGYARTPVHYAMTLTVGPTSPYNIINLRQRG